MKKIVTYLVTLGMMLSMIPTTASAADTTTTTATAANTTTTTTVSAANTSTTTTVTAANSTTTTTVSAANTSTTTTVSKANTTSTTTVAAAGSTTTTAVTTGSTGNEADKSSVAVEAMKNMNTIIALTDGADSNIDDFIKVDDERFKTIESVKKFIAENCTGDLKDELVKKCDKSLLEKEDGLYKRNSGRFFFTFLTDNGVEIVDPAMDSFYAVTKKSDQMNDYGRILFKLDESKWKVSKYEFGFFTVNNSTSDLESGAYLRTLCFQSILTMLAYGAPADSAEKITVNGVTYGKAEDNWQGNGLKSLKEEISENCTGALKEDLMQQAEARFVEKDGVLYAAIGPRGAYDFNITEGFSVFNVSKESFTAVTKKNSDKDGYGKLFFNADDGKWKISDYSFYSSLEEANNDADLKKLAGKWIYEVADGGYTVDLCSKYNGIITINEDATFTWTDAEGKTSTGTLTAAMEKYSNGSEVPIVKFSTGNTTTDFSGYYNNGEIITIGNGGMSILIRDKSYDEKLNKLAAERIENYGIIELIVSGGLDNENKEAFKVGDIPYYKVNDEKFNSIAAIKNFINENTTGKMNKELIGYCAERFVEKDGVLYESFAGRGSIGTDTTNGVKITDKTDSSFKATTISQNGIPGSGHTRAIFTADGDTWKISDIEYDTYSYNKTFDDYRVCANSRIASLIYCMDYVGRGADEENNEKIKINNVEYVKHPSPAYSIDGLKEVVANNFAGQVKEMLLAHIDQRLIEKDGVLYVRAEADQVPPDFNANYYDMLIINITTDGFKASTVKPSQRDGYGIFEYVKEGDKFLLSNYTFSSFNEERLFGGYVNTQEGGLNLREKPNTSSNILVEIPKGTQLSIYECDTDGWYKTEYEGNIGYVSADFIKQISDSDIPVSTTSTTATTTTSTTTTATTSSTASTTSSTTTDIVKGDVTKDKIIDGRDATAILTHYAKTSTGKASDFDANQIKAAEVTNDGIVDARDATLVLTYYAYTSANHSMTLDEFIAQNSEASKNAK